MKKQLQLFLFNVLALLIIASCSKDDNPVVEKAIIKLNKTSHNYGEVIINRNKSEQSFTISNIGNADLKVNSISVSGANVSEFSTDGSAKTIAPSKNYSFKTTFTPKDLGSKTAEVVIKTSIGEQKITLSSKGITAVPETGLVSFYDFAGNANDVKGSANGNTNSKTTLVKDRFNKDKNAYKIADGGAIDLGKQNFFSGADKKFSVSAWINPNTINGKTQTIIAAYSDPNGSCGGSHKEFFVSIYNNVVRVAFYKEDDPVSYRVVHSSKKVKINEWTNIVVSYDGSKDANYGQDRVKIYINGTLESSYSYPESRGSFPFDIKNTDAHVGIGEFVNDLGQVCATQKRSFLGSLDDIAIYDKVLSQAEVTKIAGDK